MHVVSSGDGTEIAVDRSGDGPPLVLVGGAFQDRTSMSTVAAALRDSFTVYEYDRRGRGSSGNTFPYSVEREIEDLAAVIDAAGAPAFVFGQSSGGALALETAAQAVRIRGLVVNEPPYADSPSTSVEFAKHLEELVNVRRPAEATTAFLEQIGTPPAVIANMKASGSWARMESFAPTLSHEVRLCNNGEVPTDRLGNVSAPTLALAGEHSPAWAHEGARTIADHVPSGEARALAGQGHVLADDVLVSVLGGFFLVQPIT